MKFLYFGDIMDKAKNREDSVTSKIWFKNSILNKIAFEWVNTWIIRDLQDFGYDGLLFDLSQLTHSRTLERQYLTRIILRLAEDRINTLYITMNQETFDLLKRESIKDMTKIENLKIKTDEKDIIKWLKDRKGIN